MRNWQKIGVILGVVLLILLTLDWDSRGTARDMYRLDLNAAAQRGLGAVCDMDNMTELWEAKQSARALGGTAVIVGAEVWNISENVDWLDPRIDGNVIGPYRTVQDLVATQSRDDFFLEARRLIDWCDAKWVALFDAEEGLMPVKDFRSEDSSLFSRSMD